MAELSGTCSDRFAAVREAFAAPFDDGRDVGASVAVLHDGEIVVDLWGGFIDEQHSAPWERDTITNVWSTTKTMTALCALMLADQGELDFHAPVARYWPEFREAGKGEIEVRHLMSHTAGLPGWAEPMTVEDLYDWEKATAVLARQEPWWEPGTQSGYHAVTQGYLVGEVVRRIAGETVGTFFAKEVAGPLGADFHIGLPAEADARVARVIPPPAADAGIGDAQSEIAVRALSNPPLDARCTWEEGWRRAEIPAAGGHGNARSVATVQGVLANGGELGGVRLLSAAGCEIPLQEQSYGPDLVLGWPIRFGIGYGLPTAEMPISPSERAYFWGGYGGSIVVIDLDQRLCVAYVMNKMAGGTVGDLRGYSVLMAAYESLEANTER